MIPFIWRYHLEKKWTSIGWEGDNFENFKDEWQEVLDSYNDDNDGNELDNDNEYDSDENLNIAWVVDINW